MARTRGPHVRASRAVRIVACALAMACIVGCSSDALIFDDVEPDPQLAEPGDADPEVGLYINEVMTRNQSTVMVEDLSFPDWVELVNASDQPVALSRVTLRDQSGDAWIGADGELAPGQHLLIWADNSTAPGHAPFALSGDGDRLTLAVDGRVVDRLATGRMTRDTSWARFPDGGTWAVTTRATPGWDNGIRASYSLDPTDALFQRERITEFHIALPPASWASLEASPYTQVRGSLGFQSAYFAQVGVRIKGRFGSLRGLDAKAAFKVDVNDYAPGQGVRGLNHLTLNNMVQDASYVHEYLAYDIFRAAGVPAPRVGWTRVHINQEYFGLYLFVETVDDTFLARWYADAGGHLYEGSYGVDFEVDEVDDFEYDEGPDPLDRSDLLAVARLLDGPATDAAIDELRTLVDLDEFLTAMAVEALTLHWDGYTTSNNYRVYHDPTTDRFQIIPWGTDQTFVSHRFDPYEGRGRVYTFCLANPGCRAEYGEALRRVADVVDELDLVPVVDELEAFLAADIAADPRRERSLTTVANVLQATRQTLAEWPAEVRGMIEP